MVRMNVFKNIKNLIIMNEIRYVLLDKCMARYT